LLGWFDRSNTLGGILNQVFIGLDSFQVIGAALLEEHLLIIVDLFFPQVITVFLPAAVAPLAFVIIQPIRRWQLSIWHNLLLPPIRCLPVSIRLIGIVPLQGREQLLLLRLLLVPLRP
jgi:hypothetical protein